MSRTRVNRAKDLWRRGDPAVLLTATGLTATLLLLVCMLALVTWHGAAVFWPSEIVQYDLKDGRSYLGVVQRYEPVLDDGGVPTGVTRVNLKAGNRELTGASFVWVSEDQVERRSIPLEAIVLERLESGDFHGFLKEVRTPLGEKASDNGQLFAALEAAIDAAPKRDRGEGAEIVFTTAGGKEVTFHAGEIFAAVRPNDMGALSKFGTMLSRTWNFISAEPRESNTQGGIFPAIFGTCMMVILMSVAVMPLGVMAAVYLREYAKQGPLVRAIRIAVSNLAGVPSIVFGLFGLGFFVYTLGGSIDRLFFSDALPTPTLGTGGILWASLTLALLTLPVVIVATEESLAAVPGAAREGALALGATKWQTIREVVIPSSAPGILTGLILAIARGAGEVAPLMLTGAVAFAAELPVDAAAPFVHVERKFMHLGFHIYDLGFQSPDVEASKPMVYATTLLLILLVVALNVTAIVVRSRLRKRLSGSAF